MVDLWSVFDAVEEMLLEEKRSTKEQGRLLKEKDRLLTEQLLLVRRAKAEDQELAEAAVLAGDVESAGAEKQVGVGHNYDAPWVFDPVFSKFLEPELDEATKEPIYDVRVLAGKKNNRQRALAVAKVYGPKLREVSLAEAIFATGETRATSAASVRSSLGGLVRYGDEWARERGSLIYLGARRFPPDKEMIFLLVGERQREREQEREQERKSLTQAS